MTARAAGAIFVTLAATVVGLRSIDAGAFSVSLHEGITAGGLSPPSGQTLSFLRPAVLDDIADQHEQVDSGLSGARDERHFDDCEFDGAAEYIRDRYADVAGRPRPLAVRGTPPTSSATHCTRAWTSTATRTGSRWGSRSSDDPDDHGGRGRLSDLLDLSGAPSSLGAAVARARRRRRSCAATSCSAPTTGTSPPGWSIDPDGGGRHVPTLIDPHRPDARPAARHRRGHPRQRVRRALPERARARLQRLRALTSCNKDDESAAGRTPRPRALATLQTGYEWCRLVREAGRRQRDGLLLTHVGTRRRQSAPGEHAVRQGDARTEADRRHHRQRPSARLRRRRQQRPRRDPARRRPLRRSGELPPLGPRHQPRRAHPPRRRRPRPGHRLPARSGCACVGSGRDASPSTAGTTTTTSGDLFASDFDDKGDDDEFSRVPAPLRP